MPRVNLLADPELIAAELKRRAQVRERERVERDWAEIRLRCRSLAGFVREFWSVLEPGVAYVHGWYIDAICEHLEAVTEGRITRLLINVPPGMMKALDSDTPVLTTWGWKRHGDLMVGDFVFGVDGSPKRVLACTDEVREEAFEIETDDGATIVAGLAHEWVVERDFMDKQSRWRRVRRQMVVETRSLKSGCRPDRIALTSPIQFPPQHLPIDPYVLGAWLGDGGTNSGCLHVGEEDVEHFKAYAVVGSVYEPGPGRQKRFYRLTVPGLQVKLRVAQLLGGKHVPPQYLVASIEQRFALLQGLMDTDGTVDKNGSCSFTNANADLAEAVASLVESLGMKAHRRSRFTILNGKRFGPHYRITFTPPMGVRIFRLQRKQNRVKGIVSARARARYVKRVRPVGVRTTKCIQVEGGVYLAGARLVPTHNSLLVNVFWPAWEWGPRGLPHLRYLSTSYNGVYVSRDCRKMLQLVSCEKYQSLWGDTVQLIRGGMDSFENTAHGSREGQAFDSLTSGRGNRLLIDDPHSVTSAESEQVRGNKIRTFRESVPTRLNDPIKDAIIVIMQRLHQGDVSGTIEKLKLPYVHVMLPMEFEPGRKCITSIGFSDPRTHENELLFPERFPREVVEANKSVMGEYAIAGQYQQRPTKRGGGMFKRHWYPFVGAAPAGAKRVRKWDLAATEEGTTSRDPDWTVGLLMAKDHQEFFYIEDVVRLRGDPAEVEAAVVNTASADRSRYGDYAVHLSQDPGQAGKSQVQYLVKKLAGYAVYSDRETGDKEVRAAPFAAQSKVGNVRIVEAEWNEAYLSELENFPRGSHNDQVDASSGAFNFLVGGAGYNPAWA